MCADLHIGDAYRLVRVLKSKILGFLVEPNRPIRLHVYVCARCFHFNSHFLSTPFERLLDCRLSICMRGGLPRGGGYPKCAQEPKLATNKAKDYGPQGPTAVMTAVSMSRVTLAATCTPVVSEERS